jgi:hypothetical protein
MVAIHSRGRGWLLSWANQRRRQELSKWRPQSSSWAPDGRYWATVGQWQRHIWGPLTLQLHLQPALLPILLRRKTATIQSSLCPVKRWRKRELGTWLRDRDNGEPN